MDAECSDTAAAGKDDGNPRRHPRQGKSVFLADPDAQPANDHAGFNVGFPIQAALFSEWSGSTFNNIVLFIPPAHAAL